MSCGLYETLKSNSSVRNLDAHTPTRHRHVIKPMATSRHGEGPALLGRGRGASSSRVRPRRFCIPAI